MCACMSKNTPACTRACAKRVFGAAVGSELQTQMQAQAKQHLAASALDQAHTRRVAKDGSRGKQRGRVVGPGADSASLAKKMGRSLRTGVVKKTHVCAAHDTSTRKVKAMRTRAASRGNAPPLFFPQSFRKPSAHVCARGGASVSLEASFSSASDESTPRRIRQISTYACMCDFYLRMASPASVSCVFRSLRCSLPLSSLSTLFNRTAPSARLFFLPPRCSPCLLSLCPKTLPSDLSPACICINDINVPK